MQYVGFWGRFGAYWIDVLVLSPLAIAAIWLSPYKYYYVAIGLPGFALGLVYHVYLVQRFGGTPGKLVLKQRIVKVSGEPVGYREALLRYVVLMVLSLGSSLGIALGALQIADSDYAALSSLAQRAVALQQAATGWYQIINVATQVWVWSEFVVLLTNSKRRALHDFMAGTVVIKREPA